jgi:sterol desaturase/sphingolipid hydroxylase (fatty acid hydroxylase superfamily)
VITVLASLALLAVVFIPLEKAFAAVKQPTLHRATPTDLAFFLGQGLLWSGLIIGALRLAVVPIGSPLAPAASALPWWLQAVLVVLIGDLVVYWAHRLSHRVPLLWRFHRVHHTPQRMDWLAAYREHPIDGLWTQLWLNLPGILIGFPIATIAGVAAFRGAWGMLIHSNVSLRLGPIRYLIGAPRLHHWHHDLSHGGRCNFANLCPLMDVLFGTFNEPDIEPAEYGISEPVPRSYLGLLAEPLLPARLCRRLFPPRAEPRSHVVRSQPQPPTEYSK